MAMQQSLNALTLLGAISLSCGGELGPQGATGPQGPAGPMGAMGAPGSAPADFPDCPIGYTRDSTNTTIILCKQGQDEVVKVGRKGSAFWIDRYEASVWGILQDGTEKQYGVDNSDYAELSPSGKWWKPGMGGIATLRLSAQSRAGVSPSRNLTWFQALELCAAPFCAKACHHKDHA